MKLKGKQKGLKTQDPRVRIDLGKLADQIAGDRPVTRGVLFGSEPPPVDTVWEKNKRKEKLESADSSSQHYYKERETSRHNACG